MFGESGLPRAYWPAAARNDTGRYALEIRVPAGRPADGQAAWLGLRCCCYRSAGPSTCWRSEGGCRIASGQATRMGLRCCSPAPAAVLADGFTRERPRRHGAVIAAQSHRRCQDTPAPSCGAPHGWRVRSSSRA